MRGCQALLVLVVVACAPSSLTPARVRVVGDGEHGVLLSHDLYVGDGGVEYRRATDDDEWQVVCGELLRDGAALPAHEHDFDAEQVAVVPLPRGARLGGIVVSSEEGVDVLTLDLDAGDLPGAQVCLLRLSRRMCQIAIILRDQARGEERLVGVLSGL